MTFAPDVECGLIKEGGEVNLDEALPQALPRWDRRERHRISCDAPSAAVMRAAEEVMCREAPMFYGLMAIMSLGHPPFSADEPVPAPVNMHKFEVLARTEEEILVGGTGRFSQSRPVIRLRRPDLAAFRDFEEPGCIKIGANFRRAHGMLTTETRVRATDAQSRRLFGLYWLFIRGGSGLIRHVWLRAIVRRARIADQPSGMSERL